MKKKLFYLSLLLICQNLLSHLAQASTLSAEDQEALDRVKYILQTKADQIPPEFLAQIKNMALAEAKLKRDVEPGSHFFMAFNIKPDTQLTPLKKVDFQELIQGARYVTAQNNGNEITHHQDHLALYQRNLKRRFPETVIDPLNDTRKLVNPSHPGICHTCGKLDISFPDKKIQGTGFIVSPYHVLTAGHCLYHSLYGGYAQKIVFYYPTLQNRWNSTTGKVGFVTSGWVQDNKDECDYGMLILNEPINSPFFMGVEFKNQGFENLYVNIMGYPTELQQSHDIYTAWGTVAEAQGSIIKYALNVDEGQSGSSVWTLKETEPQPYALGVHTQGFSKNEPDLLKRVNQGVRFTDLHYQNILHWLKEESIYGVN